MLTLFLLLFNSIAFAVSLRSRIAAKFAAYTRADWWRYQQVAWYLLRRSSAFVWQIQGKSSYVQR